MSLTRFERQRGRHGQHRLGMWTNEFRLGTTVYFVIVPAQAVVAKWLEPFKEFPIRQKPSNLDEVMWKLQTND